LFDQLVDVALRTRYLVQAVSELGEKALAALKSRS
jgi:hypothetical protein